MVEKLTFKEYLDSKDRLREAVEKAPRQTVTYTINKYSKLVIGESKESKSYINLKPKHKVELDLLYEDIDNPTVLAIRFIGVETILAEAEHKTFWEGKRLLTWLDRNGRESFQ